MVKPFNRTSVDEYLEFDDSMICYWEIFLVLCIYMYGYNFGVTNEVFCCMSECGRDYFLKMMNQTIGNIRTF